MVSNLLRDYPAKSLEILSFLLKLYSQRYKISDASDIAIIVFSKDRPMQIEALLRSASKYFKNDCSWSILWHASNSDFAQGYESVFTSMSSRNFNAIRETNFRADLLDILESSEKHGVIFLVDDLIFVNYFDASYFTGVNPFFQVPSLRLWPGATYCQTKSLQTPTPEFKSINHSQWLQFSWRHSKEDWAMPLSLDGNLFSRIEILRLLNRSQFRAPNSLEGALGNFRFLFKFRKGLCLSKAVIRNFAFNRVQTENEDFPCGSWDSVSLLQKWSAGWRLDINALGELDAQSCHLNVDPLFEWRFNN